MNESAELWAWMITLAIAFGILTAKRKTEEISESPELVRPAKRKEKFRFVGVYLEAVDALEALGFKRMRAKDRIKELADNKEYHDVEDIIRDAFRR